MSTADIITSLVAQGKQDLDAVYEAGRQAGSYGEGFEDGQKAEYDRFWDEYQQNGDRVHYSYAFCGYGWTNDTFKPKYDIRPTSAASMFYLTQIQGDFVELFENLGVTLDLSKAGSFNILFGTAQYITRLGVLDGSSASNLTQTFINCYALVTIDKLVLKSDGTTTFSQSFTGCRSLQNITIEGTIGQSIDFSACPLTPDSMISIINHLKDFYDDTANQFTKTLSFSDACWTALQNQGDAPPGYTWRSYVEGELKWRT